MCGIWGVIPRKKLNKTRTKQLIKKLYHYSEIRGKEASGIAYLDKNKMYLGKAAVPADKFVETSEYSAFWKNLNFILEGAFIGHSRLATNGSASAFENNQPCYADGIATVHNGIIINVDSLWSKNYDLNRQSQVDTEIFVKLLNKYLWEKGDVRCGIKNVYKDIAGMASTISLIQGEPSYLVAATNNGSLYYCIGNDGSLVFASERKILNESIAAAHLKAVFPTENIIHLHAREKLIFDLDEKILVNDYRVPIKKSICETINIFGKDSHEVKDSNAVNCLEVLDEQLWKSYDVNIEKIRKIKRCTKCLLPATMPFIEFDERGVCNYCHTYKKQKYLGKQQLLNKVTDLKTNIDGYDSLVTFSGGRDSSYGLHYFVKELGLKPVAYSYDWGMVTDLARRNQSRMCEKLGVELIIVSADIRKKRNNIRKNVSAWLKNPNLGMIPIFMAGDKHYFYYANRIGKELGLDSILLASNPFEKTYFKSGYCGVMPEILKTGEEKHAMERLPVSSICKMAGHYAGQFISNPRYINTSLIDTISAAASYYMIPHNYLHLYDYIPWNESVVDEVLVGQYDWEVADDTKSTWRIGDGTAAFYNYIYYMITGFTENDTLRSNQIREGQITREEGLALIYRDNRPRYDSIKWYFDTIGLPMREALDAINKMPKLY